MPRVLILSSFVAASRVGGGAQALAFARLGIEPVLAPTAIFGRHPGHGAPGGASVPTEMFESLLTAVEAQGVFLALDAVITGYFTAPEQVAVAAAALRRIRAASPAARILVDPIMGDAGRGLYVPEPVATAIATELVQAADILAPNAWELARLTDMQVVGPAAALAAAGRLGRPALVSSVPHGDDIGVVYADRDRGWMAAHARAADAPKGTGDLLAAYFTAGLVLGLGEPESLAAAVGVIADLVAISGTDHPPIEALPTQLRASARVRLEALHG